MSIRVSIIIPVYNLVEYISDCLSSVMAQTFDDGLECLIVDDCSQDGSLSAVETLLSQYAGPIHFRVLRQHRNQGVSAARNRGIREAVGQYVYFLDGDDMIVPECIQWMMDCIFLHPRCQCVFAGFSSDDTRFQWMDYTHKKMVGYTEDSDWIKAAILNRKYFTPSPCNRLVLRQLLIEHEVFFEEGIRFEDDLWNYELSKHLSCVSALPVNTYQYVSHPASFVHAISDAEDCERVLTLCRLMKERMGKAHQEQQLISIWSIIDDRVRNMELSGLSQKNYRTFLMQLSRKASFALSCRLRLYALLLGLMNQQRSRRRMQSWVKRWMGVQDPQTTIKEYGNR